jgi:hypothetical protein
LEQTRRLGRLRACSDALRRGTYRTLAATDEALVYAREIDGDSPVIVVLLRTPAEDLSIPLEAVSHGAFVDVLTGQSTSLSPELTKLGRAPFSVRVLVPAGSACAAP